MQKKIQNKEKNNAIDVKTFTESAIAARNAICDLVVCSPNKLT